MADRSGADNLAAGAFELANASLVEWMDRGDRGAVERAIKFAPFAGRYDGTGGETERFEERSNNHGIGGEHFPEQGDRRLHADAGARGLHRTVLGFGAGVLEHGAGEDILCLRVRRNAEARNVDTDDANAVNFLRQ